MKRVILALVFLGVSVPSFAGLKVHEWGTFTSVQGSNGEALAGLEEEEEALPSFIHNRDPFLESHQPTEIGSIFNCHGCKCCKGECCNVLEANAKTPLLVTQKMETPVLYFYSQKPMKVDVTVDFPQGIISQYYPKPTSFLPILGGNQGLQGGQIHYAKLEVLTEQASVPAVAHGNVYAPARDTSANFVRAQDETEKFIFYRGLGNFKTSLKVTSNDQALTLKDTLGQGIPYLLALNIQNGRANFKELGSLEKGATKTLNLQAFLKDVQPNFEMAQFESKVAPVLVAALERSGLFADEARSMVNTWRLSYFHTEGLRILYILPRIETDSILPIKISPQPEELVRTLVGRVEVLTKPEEDRLLALDLSAVKGDRFLEPKLRRVKQLK